LGELEDDLVHVDEGRPGARPLVDRGVRRERRPPPGRAVKRRQANAGRNGAPQRGLPAQDPAPGPAHPGCHQAPDALHKPGARRSRRIALPGEVPAVKYWVVALIGLALCGASIVAIDWGLYHLIRTGTCASGGP